MEEPKPTPRQPADRRPARVLAVAGLVGLLTVLVVIVALIGSAGGDDDKKAEVAATPTATSTPKPTPTAKPSPTPRPLTPDETLDRQDAIDVVRSRSFDVLHKSDWNPDDTLQVLIGRSSSGSEFAFFFVDGQYLGNDSTDPSAKIRVRTTDDLEVTLQYGTYAPGDAVDKPTGEPITVHFRYDGGQVQPVEALPAPEQRTPGRQTG
jgi:hypothetical protein